MRTNLRRWEARGHPLPQGGGDKCTAQDGAHVLGHDFLLLHAAVVLQREDHRVVGRLGCDTEEKKIFAGNLHTINTLDMTHCYVTHTHLKRILLDGFDRIFEEDLRGECVAVVNHRLIVRSIPAVQLYTAAALQQSPVRITTLITTGWKVHSIGYQTEKILFNTILHPWTLT